MSSNTTVTGKCNVYIDYNRNGVWDTPELVLSQNFTATNPTISGSVTVPLTAAYGLTRMRVVADQNNVASACNTYTNGETEDYALAIIPAIQNDAGIQTVTNLNKLMSYNQPSNIKPSLVIRNYGTDSLSSVKINMSINNVNQNSFIYNFNPKLAKFDSAIVIPAYFVPLADGWNTFTAYTSIPNGGLPQDNNFINDTIHLRFFKEHLGQPAYFDDFETYNWWYVADTSLGIPLNNLWAQGTPNKSMINYTHSGNNAWVTDLTNNYPNNNKSYLYSPAFNISINAPDTLKFWHWKQLGTGCTATIDYQDLNGNWIALGTQNDINATNWYNSSTGWTGTSSTWELSTYKVSNLTNLGNILKFRFAFNSAATGPNLNGWAIDDVSITLAPIAQDGGVSNIITPASTQLVGDQLYPTIYIKNFGTNSITSFPVFYKVGTNPQVQETYNSGAIPPGSIAPYVFNAPITVTPGNFNICSWTAVPGDFYTNNDNTCKTVIVNPALLDVGISEIIVPDTTIPSNVTTKIKVVIRNYGSSTITSIPITYQRGSTPAVTETWTGSLAPVGTLGDTVQYTFTSTFVAPSGSTFNICSWTSLTNDAYAANDKLCKTVHLCTLPQPSGAITSNLPANHNVITGQSATFWIHSISGATSYQWTWTFTDATVNGSSTDTSITIVFGGSANQTGKTINARGVNACGSGLGTPSANYTVNVIAGIEEDVLNNLWLGQNIPNPTNGLTTVEYYIPLSGEIKFNIVDILGQNVYSKDEKVTTGKHSIDLKLMDLPAGVYYYSLEFKGKRLVNKLILTK